MERSGSLAPVFITFAKNYPMHITVFGASGRTGRQTVFQALNQGHRVTAFARKPSEVTIQHKNINIIQGDILEYEKVKQAIAGCDAVISVVGVNLNKPNTILSEGTKNILRAMEETGVKRFICMSSAGILGDDAGFWFGKVIMPLFLKQVFEDKKRQMEVIRKSKADWVIVRPVGLTDSPKTGTYKIRDGNPTSRTIPRADVAEFMLKLCTDTKYDRQMPAISGH
jgi:putative NADH-flavin reductase